MSLWEQVMARWKFRRERTAMEEAIKAYATIKVNSSINRLKGLEAEVASLHRKKTA